VARLSTQLTESENSGSMRKFIVKSSDLLVRLIRSLMSGGPEPRPELAELRAQLAELLIHTSQLSDALRLANGLPIPPRHLQERVVGGYVPGFIGSGTRVMAEFESILQRAGKRLSDFNEILDLGVGCGRVIRRFHELYRLEPILIKKPYPGCKSTAAG
jgi:hypothetical protein